MLEKDLVYESFKDKDKVCESYIWCVFLEKLNSLNKDSQVTIFVGVILFVNSPFYHNTKFNPPCGILFYVVGSHLIVSQKVALWTRHSGVEANR